MDDFTALDYYTWIYEADGLQCYKDLYGQYNMEYFPWSPTPLSPASALSSPSTPSRTCRR